MKDPLFRMSAMVFNFKAFFRSGTVSSCARKIPGLRRTRNRLIQINFFMEIFKIGTEFVQQICLKSVIILKGINIILM